jgi:hypothetical protein
MIVLVVVVIVIVVVTDGSLQHLVSLSQLEHFLFLVHQLPAKVSRRLLQPIQPRRHGRNQLSGGFQIAHVIAVFSADTPVAGAAAAAAAAAAAWPPELASGA